MDAPFTLDAWVRHAVFDEARRLEGVLARLIHEGHYTLDDLEVVRVHPLIGSSCYIRARLPHADTDTEESSWDFL